MRSLGVSTQVTQDKPYMSPMGLGYLLSDVTRLLRAAFDIKMQELGLTSSSWRVLVFLARDESLSQADLARRLEVSRASLGQMIDRLEEIGYVERKAHPDDRRVWLVMMTEKARSIMLDVTKKAEIVHHESFGQLSADSNASLYKILVELRTILAREY